MQDLLGEIKEKFHKENVSQKLNTLKNRKITFVILDIVR
jgi:hypothetical protein